MHLLSPAVRRGTCVSLLIAAGLLVSGCANDSRPPHGSRGNPTRAETLPTLASRDTFFVGRILAEVRVGAMAGFDRSGDGEDRGGEGRPRRGRGGGGGGLQMGASAGGVRVGPGGDRGRERPPGDEDELPRGGRRSVRQSSTPPVAIHLRFTNTGTTPADLLIADFLSPLGNFVIHPSSLRLEPGQSLEVEPMASGLAAEITSFAITLKLRLDGAEESKTLTLMPEPAASEPPAAP